MLSYALAIVVALSSLVLFSTAFLMSDIHRQDDFLWSGIGLFYALVLWFCARNITGAVLLGQAAASTLLVSYSWQTLKLRKAVANPEQAAEINNFSLLKAANGLFNRQKIKSQPEIIAPQIASPEKVTDETIAIPKAVNTSDSAKNSNKTKSGRFGRFFGKQKNAKITNTKLDQVLEEEATKISKNHDGDVVKSGSTSMPKAAESAAKEKSEPTQLREENVNDTKSSVASEQVTQPVTESVEKLQPETDSNISTPEVPEDEPVVDSASKTSQTTKEEAPAVTTAPEATINVPNVSKSSVVPDSKPQTTSQKVSEVEDSQINKNNPAELNNEPQAEDTSANPTETQSNEKVLKSSVLDSLETVEVAEVLEALPEDAANNRGQEQENIIEVTTAEIEEINIVTEVTKVEHNLNNDNDTDKKSV